MTTADDSACIVNLSKSLGRASLALALLGERPRTEPLRLSLRDARHLLPTDVVHLCLILEIAGSLGFPSIELDAPEPSYLGVWLWRIGLWDLFPQYAPREPIHPLKRGDTDRCIELSRFTDLAGAVALGERLPLVLSAGSGAADVQGGTRTLRRLADAVYELAENTVAHSHQVSGGGGVVGYYMAQRMPKRGVTFVAVGDVGDGIPATMRSRYEDLDDLAALQYALEPGVSSDGGGGNGLHVARQMTELIKGGVMTVESGGGFVRVRSGGAGEAERLATAYGLTRVSFHLGI
jgi:hypothetical protein